MTWSLQGPGRSAGVPGRSHLHGQWDESPSCVGLLFTEKIGMWLDTEIGIIIIIVIDAFIVFC